MLVPKVEDLKCIHGENIDENKIIIEDINEPVELLHSFDAEDKNERKNFVKGLERLVRKSPEYKRFINCLKQMDITKCIFHPDVDIKKLKMTKIEFHHYPFTLYDISDTVLNKYITEQGNTKINPFEVAEEITKLHYQLKVGLVPLSKTMHELAHSGKKFINLKYVTQSYLKFIAEYSRYMNPTLIEYWQNLKDLSIKEDNGELPEDDILKEIRLHVIMEDAEEIVPIKIDEEENNIA